MRGTVFLGKKFPDHSSDAYLLLTFDGNSREEVESIYEKVAEVCLHAGAKDAFHLRHGRAAGVDLERARRVSGGDQGFDYGNGRVRRGRSAQAGC